MIEHVIDTGDTGQLKIEDYTDESDMTVELWVRSLSPVSISQLPWTYSKDGNKDGWKSFDFVDTTLWQRLGVVYLGTKTQTFVLHLGDTNTSQLNGPTDHSIQVHGYIEPADAPTSPKTIRVRVDGQWRRAVPYLNNNGTWMQVVPYVRTERGWKEVE